MEQEDSEEEIQGKLVLQRSTKEKLRHKDRGTVHRHAATYDE